MPQHDQTPEWLKEKTEDIPAKYVKAQVSHPDKPLTEEVITQAVAATVNELLAPHLKEKVLAQEVNRITEDLVQRILKLIQVITQARKQDS